MNPNFIVIGIGGEAGAGILEAGVLIAKTAMRKGLFAFTINDYPSLIKGGHNYTQITISIEPVTASAAKVDVLVALSEETVALHEDFLTADAVIIYDSDLFTPEPAANSKRQYCGVPMKSIIKELQGPDIARNTIALGALWAFLGGDLAQIENILRDTFTSKGKKIVDMNCKAAQKGFHYLKKKYPKLSFWQAQSQKPTNDYLLINGNEGLALGALRAGVKFLSIYPMTPVTSLLEFFASQEKNYALITLEPEDEISAVNMAIGASYSGARVLTATSGGGFCLMTEGVSLAGMTETPLVVVEGMRGGPSTGLATKTEQADLRFVLHAGHGDFPKVVLAPGDAAECYQEIFRAFNIAEKYQLPVILMTDKYLATSSQTIQLPPSDKWAIEYGPLPQNPNPDHPYGRFSLSEAGVSPRSFPGQNGFVSKVTSDEHDEFGQVNDEPQNRVKMMTKRMKKLSNLAQELPEPVLYGPQKAQITLLGWGSTKGVILEAINRLAKDGITANYLHLLYLKPFPGFTVATTIDQAAKTLIVENNYTAQAAGYIQEMTGRQLPNKLLKFDGTPFVPDEIIVKVKELITKT